MSPRFSICIPHEPDGSARDLILQWTRTRWQRLFPDAEIVTAGDGAAPLRNRSRMRNRCAAQATTDTLLFVDADCFAFSPQEIETILEQLPGAAMVQYHAVSRLNLKQSAEVVRQAPGGRILLPEGAGFSHTIVGGFFAMTRKAFESAGGFDERFLGWGGEDPAFQRAVRTLAGEIRRVPYMLYHLWHPQGLEHNTETPIYRRTVNHFEQYEQADGSPEAMRALVGEGYATASRHIIGFQENYPPKLNAGAEQSFRALMCALRDHNYRVTVVTRPGYPGDEYDGIPVIASPSWENTVAQLLPARALISGHNGNHQVAAIAREYGLPCHCWIHNDMDRVGFQKLIDGGAHLVANSAWVAEAIGINDYLRPMIREEFCRVDHPGQAVTLINLSANKGGHLFWELARRMLTVPFLAVKGAYGQQVFPAEIPPNVEIVETTNDVREVYARTRLLLMPSEYESYGRCALEAAASGIPTIAHPTPGLQEALGHAGTFCDRKDAGAWESAIRYLLQPRQYARQSARARLRFEESQAESRTELQRLLDRLAG